MKKSRKVLLIIILAIIIIEVIYWTLVLVFNFPITIRNLPEV
ncbi:MAG: hypothetical protein ACFFCS_05900 [Candidatus Hodarchaeota archaeon]